MQDEILMQYEIRKTNKEKTVFLEYMKNRLAKAGYTPDMIAIEEKGKGIMKSRNLVVGNPDTAKVLLGGHYDTCAWMPFPNVMAPTNPILFWGYQVILTVGILLFATLVGFAAGWITRNAVIAYDVFLLALLALMYQLMFGFRNRHTANDNTSGVITLTRLLESLPEEQRSKVCVIYFDNEEKGLFGSSFFYKKHRKQIKNKLLINFDCVGDGENVVTMADAKARKDAAYQLLAEEFQAEEAQHEIRYHNRKMGFMMFPSDQMNFKKGIGVCTLKKSPIGMYVARIHTHRDTQCREENITYLTKATARFIQKL